MFNKPKRLNHLRPLIAGVAAAVIAAAAPWTVRAQDTHDVTVMTRNGDRVSGTFEDLAGGIVYVRVSLNDQRRLPIGDVALIDLVGSAQGLPETELSVARGDEHLVLFRDGTNVRGAIVAIRGGTGSADPNEPRLVYVRTGGAEKRFPMDDVARLYFGRFPVAPAAAAAAVPDLPPGAVRVAGNADWVPTSVTVRKGDRVSFSATGRVQLSADADDIAQPAGSLQQRYAPTSPLPRNFAGALIGRVGTTAAFPIGDTTSPITMPADGPLYLRVNDDMMADNTGEFHVTVRPASPRRQ